MHRWKQVAALGAIVAAATSCGDVVRDSRAPVLLVINTLQGAEGSKPAAMGNPLNSDVITNVTSPAPCTPQSPCPTIFNDVGQVVLALALKDVGTSANPATATTNNVVTIERVHVAYTRADGRNTEGVDVPYAFDGAATGTVTASTTLTLTFELVRSAAKQEAPLVQLQSAPTVITTIATVTFYGHDLVGNAVSVTGQIQVNFANFGDTA